MTEFKERWERMTVVERIAYIRADWAKCGHTDDPMVLRIAAAVAHDVCRQAADEIERLRGELVSTANRLTEERDEARRIYCEAVILHGTAHRFDANGVAEEITEAEELARRLKWDCFKENSDD